MQESSSNSTVRPSNRTLILVGQLTIVVGLVILWHVLNEFGAIDPALIGTPLGVGGFLYQELISADLWFEAGWTLSGVFMAFVSGSVVAFVFAAVFARYSLIERLLDPLFAALNSMPRIALAPMFIMWLGLGLASKVAAGFSMTFFIVLSATVAGVRGVDADHLTLARTMGASSRKVFLSIVLPGAVPTIFAGLRIGLIFAILGVVGSEIIASSHGLGQKIAYYSSTFNMDGVIAILLFLAAISNLIAGGMSLIERRLMRWR